MIDEEKGTKALKSHQDLSTYAIQRSKLATMVAHFVIVILTVSLVYIALQQEGLFKWHPIFMTVGFILFMGEAILMFSQQSAIIRNDRKLQVRSHWIFQILSIISVLTGFTIIYINKNMREKSHFTTWHGLIGLITCSTVLAQFLAGITLLYPKLLFKLVTLGQAKMYHATFGLLNYTLVLITFHLAMWSNWAVRNITGASWYGVIACADILGLVIMNQVTSNWLPRLKQQNN